MSDTANKLVAARQHALDSVVSTALALYGVVLHLTGLRRESSTTFKVRADCDLTHADLNSAERRGFVEELVAALRERDKSVEVAGSLSHGRVSIWLTVDAVDPVAASESAYKLLERVATEAGDHHFAPRKGDGVALQGVEALELLGS